MEILKIWINLMKNYSKQGGQYKGAVLILEEGETKEKVNEK